MIITKNLIVSALLPKQLAAYLDARGVQEEEFDYMNQMMANLIENPDAYQFFTFWVGVEKESQEIVTELILKGKPVNSEVEIGYRSFDSGKGYMTEMVEAVGCWAKANDLILIAVAENRASERVLEKNGFIRTESNIYKLT